ncbi:MAG: YafY family protein [Pseudomonadota bacterium]
MRSSRLLSILILLQLRTRLTAEALAEEFEVSVRTIYRDIDALSAAGVPVYGDRGPGGGFKLLDGYRTKLTGLSQDEAEAMLMIGMPGPATELGLGAAASRAQGKMLAALPAGSSAHAERIAARFHHDPVDWYQAADDAPHLGTLARAVLDGRGIAMTYESWKGVRDWQVAPLGLVLKGGAWYLVAGSADKVITFRVSTIRSCIVTEDEAARPESFDLKRYWRDQLLRFERDLRPLTAELRATDAGLKRIAREGAYARDAVGTALRQDDGRSMVRFPIESIDDAATLVLGFGSEVEAIGPPELRARISALVNAAAARYGAQ